VSSSSEEVDIEVLFIYLYQALEHDHLKRRKRSAAEKPSLLKERELALSEKRKAETPSLLRDLVFNKKREAELPGLKERNLAFRDGKQMRAFQKKRNNGFNLKSKNVVKRMKQRAVKKRD